MHNQEAKMRKVAVALGVLFGLFVACVIFGMLLPTPEPSAEAPAVAVAPPTLAPPTATTEPTATPAPTATLPPTPEPTPTDTARDYIIGLNYTRIATGMVLTDLGALMREPKFGDTQWVRSLATQRGEFRFVADQFHDLVPPPALAVAHEELALSLIDMGIALDLIVEAAETLDEDTLDRAGPFVDSANKHMDTAMALYAMHDLKP
jgi:hypothetical protein